MNAKIVAFLKNKIDDNGLKYVFISRVTKIEYQRLMRIFHQGASISGSEMLMLCKALNVDQTELMNFATQQAS